MARPVTLALLAAALLAGCGCANVSEVARAMAASHATVEIEVNNVFGSAKIRRSNPYPPPPLVLPDAAPVTRPAGP